MSAVIGSLRGVLGLDTAAFESGERRAAAGMGRLERGAKKLANEFHRQGTRLSVGLTAPLVLATKVSLSTVDAQAKLARSLGTTVQSMQVLDRAASLSGVSMGEVEQATIQLTKRLSEVAATGKGPAAEALKILRLRAQDLQRMPLDKRIGEIQKSLEKYVPEAERAAVSTDLFGTRAGLTFTRIDTAALRIATQDIERFGVAVSETDAQQIERTNDALSRLHLVARGLGNQLATALAPSLEALGDRLAEAGAWFAGLSDGARQAIAVSASLAAAIGPVALGLGVVLRVAVPMVGAIASLSSKAVLVTAAFAGLAATVGPLGDHLDTFAVGVGALAAARLPALIRQAYLGVAAFSVMEVQFIAGAAAARGTSLAMGALSAAMSAIPIFAFVGLTTAIYQGLTASREAAAELAAALGETATAQETLTTATDAFYTSMTVKSAEAMKLAAENARAAVEAALNAAKVELESASFTTNLFGVSLWETERMAAARAEIGRLTASLAEAESRLDAAGVSVENLKRQSKDTADNIELAGDGSLRLTSGLGGAAGEAARIADEIQRAVNGMISLSAQGISSLRESEKRLAFKGDPIGTAGALAAEQFDISGFDPILQQGLQEQRDAFVANAIATATNNQELAAWTRAQNKATKATGGANAASKSTIAALLSEIAHRQTLLTLSGSERAQYEAIRQVQQRLGKEAGKVSQAQIKGLADQLVSLDETEASMQRINGLQGQWSENITRTAFEGGSLGDTISGMLRDIGYQFAHSKVVLPVVASITGVLGLDQLVSGSVGGQVLGGAAGGGGGLLGSLLGGGLNGGGLLGNVLGAGGGLLGGIGSGLGGVLSGGGLGSSFANLGGLLSGSVGGLGALGAAIPAFGIIAGAAAFLSNAFGREYQYSAIEGRFNADDGFAGHGYDFHNGGVFQSDRRYYSSVEAETERMLDEAFGGMVEGIRGAAGQLNLSADAINGYIGEHFEFRTSESSPEQIMEAFQREMENSASAMADLVLGTNEYTRSGEASIDTLNRLATSLMSANDVMDLLGQSAFDASLIGGDIASHLVDQFGGSDALNTAATAYWTAFYSEAERRETVIRRMTDDFRELGVAMPQSRDAFRAVVDGLDLTTERGRELYAELIQMAGALDEVLPKASQFTLAMSGIIDQIGGEVGGLLAVSRENARLSQTTAQLWYRTAETLRDFLSDLINTDLTAASGAQALVANRSQFQTAFDLARGGDVEAARDIPGLAKSLLDSELAMASTELEFRRIAAQVQGQVKFLTGLSELEGANQDVLTTLYQQQIDVLTGLGNFLQLEGLTNEQIGQLDQSIQGLAQDFDGTLAGFDLALGSLEGAIREAELFSYDYLKERLNVSVDLLATSSIPPYMRDLIETAQDGITTTIDFVIRSHLPAPEKWLAVNSASEHIKTIRFLVDGSQWSQAAQDLAFGAAQQVVQSVQFIANNQLGNLSALALGEAEEVVQAIRFVARAIPQPARDLVLDELGTITREINFLVGDTIPDEMQRLALGHADAFRRVVNIVAGTLPADEVQRMALAQPEWFRRQLDVLAGRLPDQAVRALAFGAAEDFTRVLNIEAGTHPSDDIIRLALSTGGELRRNIDLLLRRDLDPETRQIALAGNSELSRVVNVALDRAGSDTHAIRLALGNIKNYAVSVEASLSPSIGPAVRRLIAENSGSYAVMIEGALDLTQNERRILLKQQGVYATTITATLAQRMPTHIRKLLINATTNAVRGVTIAAVFPDTMTADERALLTGDSTVALRTISATLNPEGISSLGWLFLQQLDTSRGDVERVLQGRVWTQGISAVGHALIEQLGAGPGSVIRNIDGSVNVAAITGIAGMMLGELAAGSGSIDRSIQGDVVFGALQSVNLNYLTQLSRGDGTVNRNIRGWMHHNNWQPVDQQYLTQLSAGNGTVNRYLRGWMSHNNWQQLDQQYLTQLARGDGTISRFIRGDVDLSALSTSQVALLNSISGSTSGTITLAGQYQFTPSQAFQNWYGDQTQALATPMDLLRASIGDLRGVMVEDMQLRAHQADVLNLNQRGSAAQEWIDKHTGSAKAAIDAIRALEAQTGVQMMNGNQAATLGFNEDGTLNFQATHIEGTLAGIQAFKPEFYGANGLESQLGQAGKGIHDSLKWREWLRDQVREIGAIPSFYGGGGTGDGSRSGGLDGKGGFLAMLHPKETVTDHTMTGSLPEAVPSRALLDEIRAFRQQQAKNDEKADERLRELERFARKQDFAGLKLREGV